MAVQASTRRGVKIAAISLRCRLCLGGSMLISMFAMSSTRSGAGSTSNTVPRCEENTAVSRRTAFTSS